MNCKPGDLAINVSGDMPEDFPLLGRIVRVTRIDPDWHEPVWEYEGAPLYDDHGSRVVAISDKFLRPIRDPGDDATDEMLLLVGSPNWQEA